MAFPSLLVSAAAFSSPAQNGTPAIACRGKALEISLHSALGYKKVALAVKEQGKAAYVIRTKTDAKIEYYDAPHPDPTYRRQWRKNVNFLVGNSVVFRMEQSYLRPLGVSDIRAYFIAMDATLHPLNCVRSVELIDLDL